MFNFLYKTILDIIFPQNKLEQEINTLSEDVLSVKLYVKESDEIVSLLQYKDPLIKQMIWLLKYKRNSHVSKLFASILSEYLIEELSDEITFSEGVKTVIIPLPLSKKRQRERGYNQMELITNELQRLGEFTINTDLLIKRRHTAPQTSLSKKEDRAKNIKDAFEVHDKNNLENTHLILIDDVLTTGSTLKEAQKTLEGAGAYKVSCVALSH